MNRNSVTSSVLDRFLRNVRRYGAARISAITAQFVAAAEMN